MRALSELKRMFHGSDEDYQKWLEGMSVKRFEKLRTDDLRRIERKDAEPEASLIDNIQGQLRELNNFAEVTIDLTFWGMKIEMNIAWQKEDPNEFETVIYAISPLKCLSDREKDLVNLIINGMDTDDIWDVIQEEAMKHVLLVEVAKKAQKLHDEIRELEIEYPSHDWWKV